MAKRIIHLILARIDGGVYVHRYDNHVDRDGHWDDLMLAWRQWNLDRGKAYHDPMMWRYDMLVPFEASDDDVENVISTVLQRAIFKATMQRVLRSFFE